MHDFLNILYVSNGVRDEAEALKQALSLAHSNDAQLQILMICKEFPKDLLDYKEKFKESLLKEMEDSIHSAKKAIGPTEKEIELSVELEMHNNPAICIIQNVLKNGHDLVIKESETNKSTIGFKAVDTKLLRKCPCPVWVFKPTKHPRKHVKVLVAIDPEDREPGVHSLSKRMLELANSLTENYDGDLHIISCWDYEPETFLHTSHWIDMTPDQIDQILLDAEHDHRELLKDLIKESNIANKYQIHHLRGDPEDLIPTFVKDKNIDILIMGSVGRTGIPGYFIGNTAENIIQNLTSSLMVPKPRGFVCPIAEE